MRKNIPKEELEALYLDWVNNFLTVERFAEYYGYDIKSAQKLITALRVIFDSKYY